MRASDIVHNVEMKYGALLGWGIVIYAIAELVSSALITYGLAATLLAQCITLVSLVVVSLIAGHALTMHSWKDILPYSLGWMCILVALDALLYVPLAGWGLYADSGMWFGYALVAIAPLFASTAHTLPEPHRVF